MMSEAEVQKEGEASSYNALIKALQMVKRLKRLEGTVLIHEGILMSADTLLNERQVKEFVREVNALVAQYRNGSRPLSRALLGFDGGNVMIFHAAPFTMCLLFGNLEDAESVEKAGEEFLKKWASSLRLDSTAVSPLDDLDLQDDSTDVSEVPDETIKIQPVVKIDPEPEAAPAPAVVQPTAAQPAVVPAAQVPEPAAEAPAAVDAEKVWKAFREKTENLLSKVLGRAQAKKMISRELQSMGVGEEEALRVPQFRPFGTHLVSKVKDRTTRKQLEAELLSIVDQFTK